ATVVLLSLAFSLPAGAAQIALLAGGLIFAAGSTGPAGAIAANLTRPAIHGTAFATLTLANNLLGLAPGPMLMGVLADQIGLVSAFRVVSLA
ncbi:MFS transporter, partial [Klebsiella pneumoniae]